jgi:F-type H+-transporting ATPase subunit c
MIDNTTLIIVASILGAAAIGVGASIAATRGDSNVAQKALECMARQPEQAGNFQVNMLIAIGLVESIPIIASVIAIVLIFANPFVTK